jgi:hypothetical protein
MIIPTTRIARVHISLDLLAKLLFPDGTAIKRWQESPTLMVGQGPIVELVVESPVLPEVMEGCKIPQAQLILHSDGRRELMII